MSGKPDNEIKDTPEQKALAKVGAEQWNFAQEELAPLQEIYMDHVDNYDSEDRKSYVRGRANIGAQNGVTTAADQLVESASAGGHDLNSGNVKTSLSDAVIETAARGGDTASRAEGDLLNQKVTGLNNVISIGSGQQATAQAGLSDIANLSVQEAQGDAITSFNRNAANLQAAGTVAGAATSHYMNTPSVEEGSNMDLYNTEKPSLSQYNIL